MSIATQITRISGNVTAALTAIGNKGVTVPSGSDSDDLATLIAAIPAGLTMGVATYTPGSTTTAISFDVDGEPQYFCCNETKSTLDVSNSGSYFPTIAVWYDGTAVYGLKLGSGSSTKSYVYYYDSKYTKSYDSTTGKLTLRDPTSGTATKKAWFISGVTYQLLYFY